MSTNITMNTPTDGLQIKMTARATFDATGGKVAGAYDLGVNIPANAIIVRTYYDVLTTFQSAADTAIISLTISSTGTIGTALAINNGTNPWDAGFHEGVQTGTVANFLKTTAERAILATFAVQNLTAGKLVVFVDRANVDETVVLLKRLQNVSVPSVK